MTGALDPANAYCIAHNRPYTELATDLAATTTARYNFLTPNLCNDGHDSCAPTSDQVKQMDDWLAAEVPRILASEAYKDHGVLFIVWDEGFLGPMGLIVVSPLGKGGGYASSIPYSHGSTLRTVQTIFGLSPFLGSADTATDLGDLFQKFP
jgi:hypothetical protein